MDKRILKEIEQIAECGVITERQIINTKNRLNRGLNVWGIFANGALEITPEQTKKGLDWLMNKWKTPRGVVRKNNPFNRKQQAILENFDHFELVTFFDKGNGFRRWMMPLYRVYSKHGRSFSYVATYGDKKHPIEFYD